MGTTPSILLDRWVIPLLPGHLSSYLSIVLVSCQRWWCESCTVVALVLRVCSWANHEAASSLHLVLYGCQPMVQGVSTTSQMVLNGVAKPSTPSSLSYTLHLW